MIVMRFLPDLPLEFDTAKSHILSSSAISSLPDLVGHYVLRVLHLFK